MRILLVFAFSFAFVHFTFAAPTMEQQIDSLISKMTTEEKIGQLNLLSGHSTGTAEERQRRLNELKQFVRSGSCGALLNVNGATETKEIQRVAIEESRLKIPLLLGFDVIHGYRTTLPIPLAEAASFNPQLV